jgi:hypothetical protein
MSDDTLIDIPPPPDQRITQLFVWIMLNDDGSEGIVSADMPMEMGMRHSPLMSSKRETAMKLRPIAERIGSLTSTERDKPVTVVLRTFWS